LRDPIVFKEVRNELAVLGHVGALAPGISLYDDVDVDAADGVFPQVFRHRGWSLSTSSQLIITVDLLR
jgi:hypothetical protein